MESEIERLVEALIDCGPNGRVHMRTLVEQYVSKRVEEAVASAGLDAATGQLNSLSDKAERLTEELKKPTCRRCSDCLGCEHHWLESGVPLVEECPHGEPEPTDCEECIVTGAPDYVCKHCPATADTCESCGFDSEPDRLCQECGGTGIVSLV